MRLADATDQGAPVWSYNDHDRADDLLREALATYEASGMTTSSRRAYTSLHARAGS